MRKVSEIFRRKSVRVAALATAAAVAATPLLANHSWSTYHWARTGDQITPPVGDNTSSVWRSYVQTAVADWNRSIRIESPLVAGRAKSSQCRPETGRIEVCNSAYGQTGWLGIAQVWLSNGHIVQGNSKLNDTYFNTARYNTPAWRAAVTCQEIGHDYGLGHQDEDFNTDATTSCMEYTSIPEGNEHPDQHDYAQLEAIYNHLESTSSTSTSPSASAPGLSEDGGTSPAEWGRAVAFLRDGRPHIYMRDLGNGMTLVTHVTWAIGEGPRGGNPHDSHDH